MKYIKNIIALLAAIALCGTLIYWMCLLHWSIAVVLTSKVFDNKADAIAEAQDCQNGIVVCLGD